MTQLAALPEWALLIRKRRIQLGETQKQFAKRFKVTQPAVAQWEAGLTAPPPEVFMLLMDAV